jgi:ATP-dependent Clp protease adaptor protein ClpS
VAVVLKEDLEQQTSDTGSDFAWRTILFNCDCHSFEDVEIQLIKAIRCTLARAESYAMEVHTKGSAVVYTGPRERCEAVAMVLEAIGLLVKVSK